MILKQAILHALIGMSGSRSSAAAYHLITGRSSIQTKQDVHLFHLEKLYGVYPGLPKVAFEQIIHQSQIEGIIELTFGERESVNVKEAGYIWLKELPERPFSYFNGLKYGRLANQFMQRLLLLIQTVSNMGGGNNRFIAVTDDRNAINWVRSYYTRIRGKEMEFLEQIYEELLEVLKGFLSNEAEIFTARLSGYEYYGLSLEQLAQQYKMTYSDMHLLLIAIHHEMLRLIEENIKMFPILRACAESVGNTKTVAGSTAVTKQMLDVGMEAQEIAQQRNLKLNTIHDHIVEIALHEPEFNVESYLSKEKESKIQQMIRNSKTSKLKEIKEMLNDDTDYFQIRLALARMERKAGSV
ncbi:helix-turn-helix domain-containing protein [Aciduricibacillus chroicocephali]|uniref:Helix-turn-helix domain-containing protein n=1 Tax=Aciduricibacillus chroicocephali TaxID=3054939 RepID=A0ABY9KSF0_9BACI|nr:helix-turn-helix domain-containing protein [Bacillaceae bacterium 44XB]